MKFVRTGMMKGMNSSKEKRGAFWILEAEPEIRTLLAYLAEMKGYFPVVTWATLDEAWQGLEAWKGGPQRERVDCVISDFHLPDGNCLSWLETVRAAVPQARLVCCSGRSLKDFRGAFERLGARVVLKPQRLSDLFDLIEEG